MMSLPPESLGPRLRRLRQDRGLGAGALAKLAQVSKRSVQDWEADRYKPSGAAFDRVLAALDAPERERTRMLAEAAPAYARVHLAHTPFGAPVDVGQILRAMRTRKGIGQAEVARRVGVSQSAVARWEGGDAQPDAVSLGFVLRVLDASAAEVKALLIAEQGGTLERSDPEERFRQIAHELPPALREVALLGLEAELWWRAVRETSAEPLLSRVVAMRAQQNIMRGDLGDVEGLARRSVGIARRAGTFDVAAGAVWAACWIANRRPGGAANAVRTLGRWVERSQDPEVRNWLGSTQGFAMIRAGELDRGMAQLERLHREAEERRWSDLAYHRNDLAEAHLMTETPERSLDLLLSLGDSANGFNLAKTYLALGQEPPTAVLGYVRSRAESDWLCAQNALQVERGLADVRRGATARFSWYTEAEMG